MTDPFFCYFISVVHPVHCTKNDKFVKICCYISFVILFFELKNVIELLFEYAENILSYFFNIGTLQWTINFLTLHSHIFYRFFLHMMSYDAPSALF